MTSTEMESADQQFTLDPEQQRAIELCVDPSKRVVCVTGPAGSGKTTILKTAYQALVGAGYAVALCAPSGKAAKRIYEATGIEAMTIHRLLEYTHPGEPDPKTGKPVNFSYPRKTRSDPLDYDIVFCDEYSMVNREVHRSLFDAMRHGSSIRCFGDDNQLQPIEEDERLKGKPSIFMELLNNPKMHSVWLEKVHRQGKDSGILMNLQQILRGRTPTRNEQWDMIFTDQPVDKLRELVLDSLEEGIDFRDVDNQIITPQNKGWVGTAKLNQMLQGLFFNRIDPSCLIPRHKWVVGEDGEKGGMMRVFVGDKVIVTSNNYDLHIFNGETGRIIEITRDEEIIIDFGDREQSIPPTQLVVNRYGKYVEIDPRRDIDLAYAVTTHKMQGSEVSRVVYILNKSTAWMQNRRNFYTATGRAREHVTLITDQRSLSLSINKRG